MLALSFFYTVDHEHILVVGILAVSFVFYQVITNRTLAFLAYLVPVSYTRIFPFHIKIFPLLFTKTYLPLVPVLEISKTHLAFLAGTFFLFLFLCRFLAPSKTTDDCWVHP